MNSNTFRPAALALAAAPVALLLAVPAQAAPATNPATLAGGHGKASAVVLRAGLDVSLLDKSVQVPLRATLNEVHAPASAERTALAVELDGAEKGRPIRVLKAEVAKAKATVDEHGAKGYTRLAEARVHVPGLPLLSLIEVQEVTAEAACEVGRKPVAESNVLGHVTVLGKRIRLTSGGTTEVEVPGVGDVTLDLSETVTTTRSAAATALRLRVSVNPLKLNVAEVEGEVTLAGATCETPRGGGPDDGGPDDGGFNGGSQNAGSSGNGGSTGGDDGSGGNGSGDGGAGGKEEPADVKPRAGTDPAPASGAGDLAETGSSSATPYIAGAAAVLLAVGAGATVIARRRAQD
ncbi:SCO1860 family LAETG-anchored protein [Streptomyces sp. HB132]|uniref:SCO1860 family LAETG-anchored protein n=1 Tax=Streptomyces sp. HB132 TaxID=767388 RepID=UPI0019621348|nr:SCO1860 family LAETG-anchored protein [Streptomyces sp. HB132]MBM7438214.1 putative membrane protein YgcG [Streptomyces sp. HB132]